MTANLKPTLMGAAMGLVMLWMMHDTLMGQSTDITALIVFGGLHLLALTAILIAARFASRLSPKLTRVLCKLHRPSGKHVLSMMAGMLLSAGIAHILIHSGIV